MVARRHALAALLAAYHAYALMEINRLAPAPYMVRVSRLALPVKYFSVVGWT